MVAWQNECIELRDCGPTVRFMERVDNLIKAMSSRTPETGVQPKEECPRRKVPYLLQ